MKRSLVIVAVALSLLITAACGSGGDWSGEREEPQVSEPTGTAVSPKESDYVLYESAEADGFAAEIPKDWTDHPLPLFWGHDIFDYDDLRYYRDVPGCGGQVTLGDLNMARIWVQPRRGSRDTPDSDWAARGFFMLPPWFVGLGEPEIVDGMQRHTAELERGLKATVTLAFFETSLSPESEYGYYDHCLWAVMLVTYPDRHDEYIPVLQHFLETFEQIP